MVVSVYFLDTAPVVMDFQDYDVEMWSAVFPVTMETAMGTGVIVIMAGKEIIAVKLCVFLPARMEDFVCSQTCVPVFLLMLDSAARYQRLVRDDALKPYSQ